MHRLILLLAISVLVAAAVLQVRGSEQVVLPLIDVPLPGTCTFKRFVGAECPGCGLTRSFVSLVHGDLTGAWTFNPAGILLFGFVAAQVPYRMLQIWRLRNGLAELQLRSYSLFILALLLGGLLLQWIVRIFLPG